MVRGHTTRRATATVVALMAAACSSSSTVKTGGPREDASTTCTPGTTLECVGPGNCQGGQVCNLEGTAYGPCDCGAAGTGGSGTAGDSGADGGVGGAGASGAGGSGGADAGGAGAADADASSAETITFGENATDTYQGVTDDTFVAADFPATVNGAGSRLDVDATPPQNILIRFDVSAVPATATIQSVKLYITTTNEVSIDTFRIYPIIESWNEVDATWDLREAATSWATSGCLPPGSSDTTILGEVVPDAPRTTYAITISASVVQGWVDGSTANHGMVLRLAGGGNDGAHFESSESSATTRPALEVTYLP